MSIIAGSLSVNHQQDVMVYYGVTMQKIYIGISKHYML